MLHSSILSSTYIDRRTLGLGEGEGDLVGAEGLGGVDEGQAQVQHLGGQRREGDAQGAHLRRRPRGGREGVGEARVGA